MTKLTTHVLDIYSGKPGAGIKVELYYLNNNKKEKKNTVILNQDGRADKPLLEGENFLNGKYELVFFIGDYFKNVSKSDQLPFLDDVLLDLVFQIQKNIIMFLYSFLHGAILHIEVLR